ncbi:ABC transporter ATP-binding protein [Variovorax sp. VNK109]|uniref:ABC transporter ATP-binding protein n=1 Tax=Variovorax sp. VNK109 TaxID=3400919 RepID=UPI003C047123
MSALLSIESISLNFGGIKAVDGLSFEVEAGEVFTIIGPNGAGKTSVFNLLSRIYDATSGRILLAGEDVTRVPAHSVAARGVARTFQNIELFESASVLRNVLVGCHSWRSTGVLRDLFFTSKVRGGERESRLYAEKVMDLLELHAWRDATIRDLPYGVRKVVEIARALCAKPRLLLLDEPSSGLNVEETGDLAFWIQDIKKDLGVTVLMIEHDMGLVSQVSDRVLAVNSGRYLAMGTAEEVQRNPVVVEAYLGAAQ